MLTEDWNLLAEKLEDGASIGSTLAEEGPATISIAISLKRIADSLTDLIGGAHINVDTYRQ